MVNFFVFFGARLDWYKECRGSLVNEVLFQAPTNLMSAPRELDTIANIFFFYIIQNVIDLHTHSQASDGTYAPKNLVGYAKKVGLDVLALTDHDTVDGCAEAAEAAKALGLEFVVGVEFNIEVALGEFHLLGYGMDIHDVRFQDLLKLCKANREERNRNLCELISKSGIEIDYDALKASCAGELGRPHFAKFFQEKKIVKSVQEGFDKYFGFGRPFFMKTKGLDFEEACSVIKKTGGVAVLAHPMSLYLSWGKLTAKIESLCEKGLDGIEAWNAGTKPNFCRRLENYAKELKILCTAGSDFHGKNKSMHEIGKKSDNTPIQNSYWTDGLKLALKKAKRK